MCAQASSLSFPLPFRAWRTTLLATLLFGGAASAEVTFLSASGGPFANTNASQEQDLINNTCPSLFELNPFPLFETSALSGAETAECNSTSLDGMGSASGNAAYTVFTDGDRVTGMRLSAGGTASSMVTVRGPISGGFGLGGGNARVRVEVTEAVIASFGGGRSASGDGATGFVTVFGGRAPCSFGSGCDIQLLSCASSIDAASLPCFPARTNDFSDFPPTLRLEPGTYDFEVSVRVEVASFIEDATARQGAAEVDFEVTFDPAEDLPCDLAWAAAQTGAFTEEGNWEPAFSPRELGDGCMNLTLGQLGGYTVTYGADARANRLSVTAGSPTLSGGILVLAGNGGGGSGLRILNGATLFVAGGTVQTAGLDVGPEPAPSTEPSSLRIEPGATVNVTSGLALGNGENGRGVIDVAGEEAPAQLNVTGSLLVGGRGKTSPLPPSKRPWAS